MGTKSSVFIYKYNTEKKIHIDYMTLYCIRPNNQTQFVTLH
jgi:hypothetical protein